MVYFKISTRDKTKAIQFKNCPSNSNHLCQTKVGFVQGKHETERMDFEVLQDGNEQYRWENRYIGIEKGVMP